MAARATNWWRSRSCCRRSPIRSLKVSSRNGAAAPTTRAKPWRPDMEAEQFVVHARIDIQTLETWVEAGWLAPARVEDRLHYSEVDLARAHLINDLTGLGVNEAGVPIVLDLLDQLHGLRRALRG